MPRILPLLLICLVAGCSSGPRPLRPVSDSHYVTIQSQNAYTNNQRMDELVQTQKQIVCNLLHVRPPIEKLNIYLFTSDHQMHEYLAKTKPELKDARPAFWKGEHDYFLAVPEKDLPALRRGVTQYILAIYFPDLPPWVGEGLPHFLQSGLPMPVSQQQALIKKVAKRIYPVEIAQLIAVRPGTPLTENQAEISWAFTAYLLQSLPEPMLHYMQWAKPGADSAKIFKQSFHQDVEQTAQQMIKDAKKK